ncbi:hypothetical protein PHYBOEH_011682 [Phytophthora boehmeriae]|uniref:Uncharacterized protein n=1 Tax=Phytophthora boehmeriae TaxID=109152 RepID=A0A8T1WXG3_9STRA|nr:hypothetical protein PHYBOEH_011682 [Phytophthora boehmeriae]
MTTSREQLLALVQRRGQAQKAIKLFISLMSSSVDVRNPDKALSACLKLLESAVGTRQPSWTQILVVEGGSGGQKGDKKTAVCAAKVAQSLIKAYAATNVAATTSEEMEDLVAAMDLACMALYVACALEHMVQLGDLVVDNLLYQVAKKYADMPGVSASHKSVNWLNAD